MSGSRYSSGELRKRVGFWAQTLRVRPRIVRVWPMLRKWGSCSDRGTITLASDLVREPPAFQDFVVVHELLHLRVRNHGKLFKALMSAHIPQWRSLSPERPRLGHRRRRIP